MSHSPGGKTSQIWTSTPIMHHLLYGEQHPRAGATLLQNRYTILLDKASSLNEGVALKLSLHMLTIHILWAMPANIQLRRPQKYNA